MNYNFNKSVDFFDLMKKCNSKLITYNVHTNKHNILLRISLDIAGRDGYTLKYNIIYT